MSSLWALLLALVPAWSGPAQDAGPEAPLELELPASEPGAWQGFFVDHRAVPERLAEVPPRAVELTRQAQLSYSKADYPRAYRLAEEALGVAPDFPPGLLLLGTTAFRLRRHGDVRDCLERFLEVAPSELWRTQVLGHALYSLGDFEAARDHYQAVLEQLPSSAEARRGLGLALFRLGQDQAALEQLEALVEAQPDSPEAWAWLAQVRFDADDLEAALVAARRAMALDRFDPRAFYLASRALFDLGQEREAEALEARWQELTQARSELDGIRNRLLFAPSDEGLHMALVAGLARPGDLDQLERAVAHLLALPADAGQLLERGLRAYELLYQAGAEDRAATLLDKLLELYPTEPRLAAIRALRQSK